MDFIKPSHQRTDSLAYPMFLLSLFYLFLLGTLVVVEVDIPRVSELADLDSGYGADVGSRVVSNPFGEWAEWAGRWSKWLLLCLWPLFWFEYLLTIWPGGTARGYLPGGFSRLLVCLVPPLRLVAPAPDRGYRIWLPGMGWQIPGRVLSRKLDRLFSKPMLLIALTILPILVIEFGFKAIMQANPWLQLVLHVSTGLIWFAFTVEFIIMLSATDRKLTYVRKNWVDLAIILLPLISFLRSLRMLRLARLAKVQKLAKISRIYRMRGLLMKAVRALMLFEVVYRLLGGTPEKRLEKLQLDYAEKLEDLDELRSEIEQLEDTIRSGYDVDAAGERVINR